MPCITMCIVIPTTLSSLRKVYTQELITYYNQLIWYLCIFGHEKQSISYNSKINGVPMVSVFKTVFVVLMTIFSLSANESKLGKKLQGRWVKQQSINYGDTLVMKSDTVTITDSTIYFSSGKNGTDYQYYLDNDSMKTVLPHGPVFEIEFLNRDSVAFVKHRNSGNIVNGWTMSRIEPEKKGLTKYNRKTRKQMTKLEGEWRLVKGFYRGEVVPISEDQSLHFSFKEDSTLSIEDNEFPSKGYQPYVISEDTILLPDEKKDAFYRYWFAEDTLCALMLMNDSEFKMLYVKSDFDIERASRLTSDAKIILKARRKMNTIFNYYRYEAPADSPAVSLDSFDTESKQWLYEGYLQNGVYFLTAKIKENSGITEIPSGEYFRLNSRNQIIEYSHPAFVDVSPYTFTAGILIEK